MNGNPRAILTGALLAAGTAGIQAALTALGCGPAGIVVAVASVLTTAITVLGPKLIELRARQQFSKDIRWLVERKPEAINTMEIANPLKDYQDKALDAHVAAIKAAEPRARERNPGQTSPSRTAA